MDERPRRSLSAMRRSTDPTRSKIQIHWPSSRLRNLEIYWHSWIIIAPPAPYYSHPRQLYGIRSRRYSSRLVKQPDVSPGASCVRTRQHTDKLQHSLRCIRHRGLFGYAQHRHSLYGAEFHNSGPKAIFGALVENKVWRRVIELIGVLIKLDSRGSRCKGAEERVLAAYLQRVSSYKTNGRN